MSKASALKKALKKAGKVAAGAGAAKLAYDGLTKEDAKPRTNPHKMGTKEYVDWETSTRKSRTGK